MPQATIEQALQIALQHHQSGRLSEAESIYRQILAVRPNHHDSLHLLGTLRHSAGHADGVTLIRQAIALKPDFPQALSNLGEALRSQGQLDEAIACFRRALVMWPNFPAALGNLGLALTMAGQYEQAVQALRQAVKLEPNFADAWANLGSALAEIKERSEAIVCFRRAITLRPNSSDFYNNLGVLLRGEGLVEEAISSYRRAISIRPDGLEAYCNLADLLRVSHGQDEAIEVCRRGMALGPNYPEIHLSLANALQVAGRLDEAVAVYHRALVLKPDWPEPLSNLGLALPLLGRFDEAIECCRRAITLRGDYAEAHANLALILLLLGQWQEGWEQYEWRYRSTSFPNFARCAAGQHWDGSDLTGRTILLRAEQGLGDAIQFVRFVPQVIARGGRVLLEVPPELQRLLQGTNSGGATVILQDDRAELPAHDVVLPLMSLPAKLGKFDPDNIPKPTYITADPVLREQWRNRLASESRLKIGLVWAGNSFHRRDSSRSIPLSMLAPLAHENLCFYTLQFGPPAAQAASPPPGMTLINLTDQIRDFADTAAFIAELDGVVSVDTAAAHLAGAMGKPAWLLLPVIPDFRWLLDRPDTPWYPTMRLFRQTRDGDWQEPIARLARELTDVAKLSRQ
jgi:tetratricopeptide (TPR) repeat protein